MKQHRNLNIKIENELINKTKMIYGDRQSGRTTELIKMCSKDRYSLIVCPNYHMCNYVFALSKKLGYKIPYPITIFEFSSGRYYGYHIQNFYFDEVESCLTTLSRGVPVKGLVFGKHKTDIIEMEKKDKKCRMKKIFRS